MQDKALTVEDSLLLAYANFKLRDYKQMLRYVQKALKMRPDFALAHHYKALALRGLGDLKGAENAIKTAINKEGSNFSHTFLLGIIQWNTGDMDSAEKNLKKAIRYTPNEPVYHAEYATFLIHRGRFEEALDAAYKAKSMDKDNDISKLKDVIKSARQKEFREGIDELAYEPPLPFNPNTPIPYIRLGNYYVLNSFLSNAQMQFSKALHQDPNNVEAKRGFATATRLKEGGFYTFANNFARFLAQWPAIVSIVVLLAILALAGWAEPFFRLPAIGIGAFIVITIVFFLVVGFKRRGAGEYEQILREWGVEDIDTLMEKLKAMEARSEKELEEEAIKNRANELVGYASFFSMLAMIALVAQIIAVNIDTSGLTLESQDTIANVKVVLLLMLGICFGLAIYFRTRSRALLEESSEAASE